MSKTGFCSADLSYRNTNEANYILDTYSKSTKQQPDVSLSLPSRSIFKKGVITDWDMSISKLINAIDSKDKIESIERMTKRKYNSSDNSSTRINTNNLIITFKGTQLPTRINIYSGLTFLNIRPYIPAVKQCHNCYKFHHFRQYCHKKKTDYV